MSNIGENIKRERKKLNLTQKGLADKLFVTPQAVSRWELNEVEPSLTTLSEMAKLFNISVDQLLNGEKVEEKKEKVTPVMVDNLSNMYSSKRVIKCEECGKDISACGGYEFIDPKTNKKKYLCTKCYEIDGIKYLDKKKMPIKKRRWISLLVFILLLTTLVLIEYFALKNSKNSRDSFDYFFYCALIPFVISSIPYNLINSNTTLSSYHKKVWRKAQYLAIEGIFKKYNFINNILSILVYMLCVIVILPLEIILLPIFSPFYFFDSFYRSFSKKYQND